MKAVTTYLITLPPSTELIPVVQARNVVLFGECGVGKSSIINAVVGGPVARTSNDVLGCTDENTSYVTTLDTGIKVNIWDTVGLDEGTAGRIPADHAKQRLKLFLQTRLTASDGVDLLLYCVRGASGTKNLPVKRGHWEKYKFVFEEVCKKRVPIAMVVTHLESYDTHGDMDTWWERNEPQISGFGFQFCAHACIAIIPPEIGDANRVEISRRRLRDLLSCDFLAPRNVLLLGDREDRDDFLDMITHIETRQSSDRQVEGASPLACIPVAFDGHTHVNLWNAHGFDESNNDSPMTEKSLKVLVRGIRQTAGVDLIVLCFRAGRPKIRHARNYRLFYAAICRKKVPVAIIVLGPEEGANTWWQRNEQDLGRRGFLFDRHVYIPCGPGRLSGDDLGGATRRQLVRLFQEEHTSGSWTIGDNAFWVTVPNVRAVVGELAWPTTTVIVCDATGQGAFADIVPRVQSSLRCAIACPQREHRFQQVDPQSFSPAITGTSRSPGIVHRRVGDRGNNNNPKGISLVMLFARAEEPGDDTWRTLERFYSAYKGDITPFVVVVYGAPEKQLAEDFWRAAPRHVRRRIGAYLTHHPGPNACPEAQAVAQETIVDVIRGRCLIDLGGKVGLLQEILSVWKKYRSRCSGASDGAARYVCTTLQGEV